MESAKEPWMISASHVWLNRMAETLVGPSRHDGSEDKSATFQELGTTKGYAHWNGRYAERTGRSKRPLVYRLRRDAWRRLNDPLSPAVADPFERVLPSCGNGLRIRL